jgi:hypothetical protein
MYVFGIELYLCSLDPIQQTYRFLVRGIIENDRLRTIHSVHGKRRETAVNELGAVVSNYDDCD